MGSFACIENYRHSLTPAYKVTKAAQNMLTVQYAQQYEAEGFTIVAVSPGVCPSQNYLFWYPYWLSANID